MYLHMTDETGATIARGSGESFVKAAGGEQQPRRAPMLKSYAETGSVLFGHEAPLLKSHAAVNGFDVQVARLQATFGRCKTLELLDYLGLTS